MSLRLLLPGQACSMQAAAPGQPKEPIAPALQLEASCRATWNLFAFKLPQTPMDPSVLPSASSPVHLDIANFVLHPWTRCLDVPDTSGARMVESIPVEQDNKMLPTALQRASAV